MPKSMTGFAKRTFSWEDARFELEIRSINHRYLELHLHLPRYSMELDQKIRKKIESKLHRGKVNLNIRSESSSFEINYELDEDRLDDYIKQMRLIEARYELLATGFSAMDLVKLPGVLIEKSELSWPEALEDILNSNLDALLDELNETRLREGLRLASEIEFYLQQIERICDSICRLRESFREESKLKFESKLRSYEQAIIDEQRLHMELAFIVEKSDVEEELVRLKSHLGLARDLLKSDDSTGKDWNFLCQEFNREINTIGSKSNQLEISQLILQAKSWLEKIREQVQNIE